MALNLATPRETHPDRRGAGGERDARHRRSSTRPRRKSRSSATTAWSAPRRRRAPRTGARPSRRAPAARSCHTQSDGHTMHRSPAVVLGCTDCHGGNPTVIGAGRIDRRIARRPGLCRGARAGARAAALSDRLALSVLGQSAPDLHPAQHRGAGICALHQPVRLSRGARQPAAPAISRSSRRPSAR